MVYSKGRPPMSSDDDSDDSIDYYMDSSYKKRQRATNAFKPEQLKPEESLLVAVRNNDVEEVKKCLASEVNLEYVEGGWTVLMYACFNGSPEIVSLLLEKGSNVNFHKGYFTPLMAVCSNSTGECEQKKMECIRILLDRGVDINAVDRFRTSSLMLATKEGLTEVVKMLIANDCDINLQDKDGWSALFHAVFYKSLDVVDILLASKAKVDLTDMRGRTLSELAVSKGLEDLVDKFQSGKSSDEPESQLFDVQPVMTITQLLDELPGRNIGENPGFPSDIYTMLYGMDLKMYAECFYKHDIQLGEFLVIDDERLKEIGVGFSAHRKKLLIALKRFHLHKWQRSSLTTKSKFQTLELLDGLKIMGNVVRQIHVIQSTLNYICITRRVHTVTKELQRMIGEATKITKYTNKEILGIHEFSKHVDSVKKVRPVDLISGEENKRRSVLKINMFMKIGLAFALGFLVVLKQKNVVSFQLKGHA